MNKKKLRIKRVFSFRRKFFNSNSNINMLSIFKSNKYIYCQIISSKGDILVSVSSMDLILKNYIYYNFGKNFGIPVCAFLGRCIAYKALLMGLNFAIFDRSGYKYHGCVKSIFLNAQKFGLNF